MSVTHSTEDSIRMRHSRFKHVGCALLASLIVGAFIPSSIPSFAQQAPTKFDIERARVMLEVVRDDVKKNYYDPNYHGVEIDARFKVTYCGRNRECSW